MVKIRLKRMGTTKRPVYRLVVADSRSPRDGRFIEALGFYDPLPNPAVVRIDEAKVRVWIGRGARPSDSARQILVQQGILAARPRPVSAPVEAAGPVAAGTPPRVSSEIASGLGPVAAGTPPRVSSEIASGLPPAAPPAASTDPTEVQAQPDARKADGEEAPPAAPPTASTEESTLAATEEPSEDKA